MSSPSVTYTFANATTADATQVNTNFTDLINGASDGTKDYSINQLTVAGAASLNGAVTLGNATVDDLTFTGSVASHIPIKTNATYSLGSATLGALSVYLGNGIYTTRILAGTLTATYTITLPPAAPATLGMGIYFDASATASFRYSEKFVASKTGDYTITVDETVIPCAPSASMTLTLPAVNTCTGKSFTVIKTDAVISKTVTINTPGSETINGAATYVLYTQWESVTIKSDGVSNWYIQSHFASSPWTSGGAWSSTIGATTTAPQKADVTIQDVYYWRRQGDSCYIRLYYKHTSSTGTTTGTGDYKFPLPAALGTIDTTKCLAYATTEGGGAVYNDAYAVGNGTSGDNSGNFTGTVVVFDSGYVRMMGTDVSSPGAIGSAYYQMNTTNKWYTLNFVVPMTGWNA